jgi:hypothetical protein
MMFPHPDNRIGSLLGLAMLCMGCSTGTARTASEVLPEARFAERPNGPLQDADLGDMEEPEPFIFEQSVLHTIALEIPPDSVASLGSEPYEYVLASATIDGVEIADVGLRLRGKIGSFRPLSKKPKLKLDFNEFVDGRRVDGLESLSLNNSIVDCSFLKETLGYAVFAAIGAPAVRTSYTQLTINDENYGLYVVVETQDDRFVKERWDDPDGNLYDGKYVWYGGSNYTLLDFGEGNDTLYQLEEGTDVEHADIASLSEALTETGGGPDYYETMGEVLDWDHAHRVWAGEQWVGQNDGYCLNKNNYRVYFDPEDGRADFIPWDLDYSMLRDVDWGRDWEAPSGNIARACFADDTCWNAHRLVVADSLDVIETLDLEEQMDRHLALVEDLIYSDPKAECSPRDIPGWHTYVQRWITQRSSNLESRWDL